MGASDYMVGNAPQGASYAAPLVGQQLGETIGNYPKDYFEGQQRQRQLAVMNAFPNGVPVDPKTGQADLNGIMSTLSKAGGGQYVQQLMPFLIQQQIGAQAGQALNGADAQLGGGPAPNTQPGVTSTGPANLTPRPQQQPQQQPAGVQPVPQQGTQPISSAGMDNNGAPTVRSIMSEKAGGRDVGTQIASVARTLRLNPDAPLTPEQVQRVQSFKANAVGLSDDQPQQPQQPQQETPSRDDASTLGSERELRQKMDSMNSVASRLETYAASTAAINPATSQAALAKAKALREQSAQIFEYISKGDQASYQQKLDIEKADVAKTNEEKNARNPAVSTFNEQQERNKKNVDRWDKDQQSYVKMARQADEARPQLQLAAKMTQAPGFIAGSGQPWRDTLANVAATVGLAPNAPVNQIFDKIRASGILDQIKGMAGTGPVRVAEMKFIDTMMAGRENQPEALRAVLNIQDRLYERSQQIRDIINANGGNIDKRVEGLIDKFVNEHQLFTKEEMRDYRAIGAPTFATPQELAAAHLPHGYPFKTADGRIKYTP